MLLVFLEVKFPPEHLPSASHFHVFFFFQVHLRFCYFELFHTTSLSAMFVYVHVPQIIGSLRPNDADDNKKKKKTIGLISKTTTSHVQHTFLFISFPFLHDYDVKMLNFAFYGATTKFNFSF